MERGEGDRGRRQKRHIGDGVQVRSEPGRASPPGEAPVEKVGDRGRDKQGEGEATGGRGARPHDADGQGESGEAEGVGHGWPRYVRGRAGVGDAKENRMHPSLRLALVPAAVAAACSLLVAGVVLASRGPSYLLLPAASSSSTPATGILTSGDAIVSQKPDLATVSAGVQSQAGTAAGAQSDLAGKLSKLVSKIKSLGVPDKDLSTSGYWVGPIYNPNGDTISGYRASVQLVAKWHNVDTVGKAVDAIVQEGGATNISVGFGLNDPKAAQAQARALAIADARSRAEAMASAAGVKLGPVVRITDIATYSRAPVDYAGGAAAAVPSTQIPVGQMDVQVSVEVDYALG
jgi:uncharacterized protein